MYFICATEMKESLSLKFGNTMEGNFFNPICISRGFNPGLRRSSSAEETLSQPSSWAPRRVKLCLPGFGRQRTELRARARHADERFLCCLPGPARTHSRRGCGAKLRRCSAADLHVSASPSRLGPRIIVEYCHLPNCAKWPPPIINNSWNVAPRHVTKARKLMNETPTRENLGSCLLSHYPRGPAINLPSF